MDSFHESQAPIPGRTCTDDPLNLVSSLHDLQLLCVSVEPLHWMVAHISSGAQNLQAIRRGSDSEISSETLRDCNISSRFQTIFATIYQVSGAEYQSACSLDTDRAVR